MKTIVINNLNIDVIKREGDYITIQCGEETVKISIVVASRLLTILEED